MSKKILIADDDPVIVRCVEGILSSEGFEVAVAENGKDALDKIKKEQPDLLILDIEMPEKNGYDVCQEVRCNEGYKKIPIVILTAREQEFDDAFGTLQEIEYVAKPIVREVLLERIAYLLGED